MTTTQKEPSMTDTPTSVTITATDPKTHQVTTRIFTDTYLTVEGDPVWRTARDQANDYIKARRAAGCEIKEWS